MIGLYDAVVWDYVHGDRSHDDFDGLVSECKEEGEGICLADFDRELFLETRRKLPVWV